MSDIREYPDRPIIGIGVIVFRGEDVLLIRRSKPPNKGGISLPGGGQDLGETVRLRLAQGSDAGEQAGIIFHANGTAEHVGLLLSSQAGVRRMVLDPARGRLVIGGS